MLEPMDSITDILGDDGPGAKHPANGDPGLVSDGHANRLTKAADGRLGASDPTLSRI